MIGERFIKRSREAMRRFGQCITANDIALGRELVSASAAFTAPVSPDPPYGAKEYLCMADLMRRNFPDVLRELEDMAADETTAAVQWSCSGTFSGAPFAGLQPDGRKFATAVMNFYTFDSDGKIIGDVAAGIAGILQGIGALSAGNTARR